MKKTKIKGNKINKELGKERKEKKLKYKLNI